MSCVHACLHACVEENIWFWAAALLVDVAGAVDWVLCLQISAGTSSEEPEKGLPDRQAVLVSPPVANILQCFQGSSPFCTLTKAVFVCT